MSSSSSGGGGGNLGPDMNAAGLATLSEREFCNVTDAGAAAGWEADA